MGDSITKILLRRGYAYARLGSHLCGTDASTCQGGTNAQTDHLSDDRKQYTYIKFLAQRIMQILQKN